MQKRIPKILVVAALIVVAVLTVASCGPATTSTTTTPAQTVISGSGEAVFFVTDAAEDMGAVTSVTVTIDSLRVHSQANAWTTVSTAAQTYELLELKASGKSELLVQADIPAGTYDQCELNISKVIVADAEGSHEAKLPSSKLQIKAALEVKADATATAGFDFIADESLHLTGQGTYIMAPVIQVETRNEAQVQINANNEVQVNGGKVVANVEVGMDVDGNVDVGLNIGPDIVLDIGLNGKIVKVQGQAAASGTLKSVDTAAGTMTMTTAGGADLVLKVDSATRVNGETTGSVNELLAANIGSNLRVEYNVTTQTATMIGVQGQLKVSATVSGTLKAVDVVAGTIIIAADTGAEIDLKIVSNTEIKIGGTVSTLVTLAASIGSNVTAQYDARAMTAASVTVQN